MAQTHYLEHTYQSDSCKKKGCRRWPRQTFADFPFAETHSGHLSLVAFRSCRGNSPSISIPRNSPAPSFWELAHPEFHRVRSARPLLARAPPHYDVPGAPVLRTRTCVHLSCPNLSSLCASTSSRGRGGERNCQSLGPGGRGRGLAP